MKESSILDFPHVLFMFLIPQRPYYLPFCEFLAADSVEEFIHGLTELLGEFKIKTSLARF